MTEGNGVPYDEWADLQFTNTIRSWAKMFLGHEITIIQAPPNTGSYTLPIRSFGIEPVGTTTLHLTPLDDCPWIAAAFEDDYYGVKTVVWSKRHNRPQIHELQHNIDPGAVEIVNSIKEEEE